MIQEVVEGVRWIPGKDRFLPDSHVYVVGKPNGEDFSLVDCGLMGMGSYKIGQLNKAGIPFGQIKRIVMTHTHLDHLGCLPELLKEVPHAEVWMHREEALYLERCDDSVVFGNSMFEAMIRAQMSIPKDLFRFPIHRKLEGEEVLDLGGISFRVMHIPGHSSGSIGLFNEEHRMFMSGDTIYADGAIGRYDLQSANPAQLRQSLERIAQLEIDILLPCHNRIVTRGADAMVKNTVKQWAPILG